MSRPAPRYRWYLSCLRGEDGTYAAHVLRPHSAPHGFWVPEEDESHLSGPDVWCPGRHYRNKRAVDRAIRQLLARFPGIHLEKTHQDHRRRVERVWTVG